MELSETKNSLTLLTETEINLVEFGVPFLVNFGFTVSNENVRAVFPDSLGSTFHVNAIVTVTGLLFDDGEGEFDCRVEGHSCKLSFGFSDSEAISCGVNIFNVLEESNETSLCSISHDWNLDKIDGFLIFFVSYFTEVKFSFRRAHSSVVKILKAFFGLIVF